MAASRSHDIVHTSIVHTSRAVLARNSKSFRLAALFLPRGAGDDAAILYAFCRAVDDAVDGAPSPAVGRKAAETLADELAGTRPPRASIAAFVALAARRNIDVRFAELLIEGAASDARERVRIDDDAALLRYCFAVAGTVGAMMCPVLGVTDGRAQEFAVHLGTAMQLTNICRDVLEDARMGRVYLPASRLRAHGVEPDDVVRGVVRGAERAAIARVVLELLALADELYVKADAGMCFIPWRARIGVLVASRVYRSIGVQLRARHRGDAFHGRTVVSPWGKLVAVTRALLAAPLLALRAQRVGARNSEMRTTEASLLSTTRGELS